MIIGEIEISYDDDASDFYEKLERLFEKLGVNYECKEYGEDKYKLSYTFIEKNDK